MTLWATDAYCVRYLRVFQLMRWPYKLAALSFVLAPLLLSYAATLSHGSTIGVGLYWCIVGIMWLVCVLQISLYFRGNLASRSGVQPALPGKRPDLRRDRERLVIFIVLVGLYGLVAVIDTKSSAIDLRLLLLFSAVFVMQLSTYAHHVFWDADLDNSDGIRVLRPARTRPE